MHNKRYKRIWEVELTTLWVALALLAAVWIVVLLGAPFFGPRDN
jgi:hypothetical protein